MLSLNKKLVITILLLSFLTSLPAFEQDRYKNTWEVGFTFGEIPFLFGSFKPGVILGYHFNEKLFLTTTYQFKDYLQRDDESFNARNIGLNGLAGSKETTGERILFSIQYRPVDWSPYLIAGFVYNNTDVETINFDRRERQIGEHLYNSEITLVQKRESGFVPAMGFGYRYDFSNGITLNTSIAMGFFSGIPNPEISINSGEEISSEDEMFIKEGSKEVYLENFHNHYHIFNLGASYTFK